MKIGGRLISALRWVWRHKVRSAGSVFALLVLSYGVVFMMVSCAVSPTDRAVSVDGGRELAYQRFAGGDPDGGRVILVHGAPADASSWAYLLRKHREDLAFSEVVVVDRLGYGNSAGGGQELTLAGHAQSLRPLLEEVNGKKPVLVGHSYGGPVVLRAAVDFPEQVGGIVLAASATDPGMKDSVWFREMVDGVSPVVPEPWAVGNRELLALTDENKAMSPKLARVVCAVVVIHGEWDPVCPHDGTVNYLRGSLVNASSLDVVSLPRTGHNVHLSHPGLVAERASMLAE